MDRLHIEYIKYFYILKNFPLINVSFIYKYKYIYKTYKVSTDYVINNVHLLCMSTYMQYIHIIIKSF